MMNAGKEAYSLAIIRHTAIRDLGDHSAIVKRFPLKALIF